MRHQAPGTRDQEDAGTRGRGDAETRGRGDAGTRGGGEPRTPLSTRHSARSTRRGMFVRVVAGSLRHRLMRVGVAALSVLMGASLVAALANLSLDVGSKAGRELRAYGANVVLTPRVATAQVGIGAMEFGAIQEERYLEEASLAALDGWQTGELMGYAPDLAGVVEAGGRRATLMGVRFERVRSLSPWWAVTGDWAEDMDPPLPAGEGRGEGIPPLPAGEGRGEGRVPAMVGARLARQLGLQVGDSLPVKFGSDSLTILARGLVETGGSEESRLYVALPAAQRLLGKPGLVGSVEVSVVADRRPIQAVAEELERSVPGSRARVVGQIADAEASTLEKVRMLVGLVAVLVLLASGLAVASTMAASVMERTREIGLMKALGARSRTIALLFLAEVAVIALVGGAAGYALGLGLAQFIGRAVFGTGIAPTPLAAPLTLAVALGVCLLASLVPIRRAVRVDPAVTLRGE